VDKVHELEGLISDIQAQHAAADVEHKAEIKSLHDFHDNEHYRQSKELQAMQVSPLMLPSVILLIPLDNGCVGAIAAGKERSWS
jgi:hypothetical protein